LYDGQLGDDKVVPVLLDSTTPASTRDEWCTPPWLLNIIRQFKPIGFDPCSNSASFVGAACTNNGRDGLEMSWLDKGLVFVNPPYSKGKFYKFCNKMTEEAARGAEIIALVPVSNVETKAWQEHLWHADAWCFPKKRINFFMDGVEKRGVNFASALVYFGPDAKRFMMHFNNLGKTVGNLL
jgi:hypothetical protein